VVVRFEWRVDCCITGLPSPAAAEAPPVARASSTAAMSRRSSEMGLCVTGSMPMLHSFFFSRVFQWFLMSLSVRPGILAAMRDHLIQQQHVEHERQIQNTMSSAS